MAPNSDRLPTTTILFFLPQRKFTCQYRHTKAVRRRKDTSVIPSATTLAAVTTTNKTGVFCSVVAFITQQILSFWLPKICFMRQPCCCHKWRKVHYILENMIEEHGTYGVCTTQF